MDNRELLKKLNEMLSDARRIYEANGRADYDAGVYKGIERALEAVRE